MQPLPDRSSDPFPPCSNTNSRRLLASPHAREALHFAGAISTHVGASPEPLPHPALKRGSVRGAVAVPLLPSSLFGHKGFQTAPVRIQALRAGVT